MQDSQTVLDQLLRDLCAATDGLIATSKEFQLPPPPQELEQSRGRLNDKKYKILVVGEVKRGKSTFVNALIGKTVLPEDVDIATSQVFHVSRSETEAYRLRFEDDSTQKISRDDLPVYGFQLVADVEGVPRLDQIIRWIEVDVPVRFLPAGLTICDMPGLGGMYELHGEITQRFLPEADAVVFVLDSTRPITEDELGYVEEILKKTNSILFVQTKIDLFDTNKWQDIQRRNQEILRERFKDRLKDCRVWPISSTLLIEAAVTHDVDFEIASKHRELAPALQAFLLYEPGITRSAETLSLAGEFHDQSALLLTEEYRNVTEESRSKRESHRRDCIERKESFLKDWGPQGKKRRELLGGVKKVATLGKAQINQFLGRGGELETSLVRKVMAADSIDSIRAISDQLPSIAAAQAMRAWREITEHSWSHFLQLMSPFLKDLKEVNAPDSHSAEGGFTDDLVAPQISRDWYAKLKAAKFDFLVGTSTGGLAGWAGGGLLLTLGVITSPISSPILALIGLAGGLLAILNGTRTIDQNQLRTAKQEVSRYASDICHKLGQYFLEVDLAAGSFSRVDEYFTKLEEAAESQVETLTQTKSDEIDRVIRQLEESALLSEQERAAKAEQLRQQMATWNSFGRALRTVNENLTRLDRTAGRATSTNEPTNNPKAEGVPS